jgi:hypothetical protein
MTGMAGIAMTGMNGMAGMTRITGMTEMTKIMRITKNDLNYGMLAVRPSVFKSPVLYGTSTYFVFLHPCILKFP